jgi:hypothetical protein
MLIGMNTSFMPVICPGGSGWKHAR